MSEPKISKTRAAVTLIAGLVLAGLDLRSPVLADEMQFLFYLGLYFIALAVQQLFHASSEAQRGLHGAFLLVIYATVLRGLVHAFDRNDSAIWIIAAVTLAMALLSFYLYWFRSDSPSHTPSGDSGA